MASSSRSRRHHFGGLIPGHHLPRRSPSCTGRAPPSSARPPSARRALVRQLAVRRLVLAGHPAVLRAPALNTAAAEARGRLLANGVRRIEVVPLGRAAVVFRAAPPVRARARPRRSTWPWDPLRAFGLFGWRLGLRRFLAMRRRHKVTDLLAGYTGTAARCANSTRCGVRFDFSRVLHAFLPLNQRDAAGNEATNRR